MAAARSPCRCFKSSSAFQASKYTVKRQKNGKRKLKRMLSCLFVEEGKFFISSWFCILEMFISIYRNICTILNARTLTARRRKLDVTKESSCTYVTNKFHSGKLCSAPPTKFFPYADVTLDIESTPCVNLESLKSFLKAR